VKEMPIHVRLGLLLVPFCLAAACSGDETADPVSAPPGIVQPEGNGVAIDEATACQRIRGVAERRSGGLGCDAIELLPCPAFIRPPGGGECLVYDEGTVVACETVIDSHRDCSDFDTSPCIVTVLDEPGPGCAEGGAGGVAGASGVPVGGGAGGIAGSPSVGGSPGAAGRGGSAGQPSAGTAGR
jgi:hypothetical protein